MPFKPARACKAPRCPNLTNSPTGYCQAHASMVPVRPVDTRSPDRQRDYGREWRGIRAEVLMDNGIPRSDWPKYDVDHNPRYDRNKEPDHRKYRLIPRLHADHSRKTVLEDGGWGRMLMGTGGSESLQVSDVIRRGSPSFHASKMPDGGV